MFLNLTEEKAFIFRIIHRQNVPWALDHGLHCRHAKTADPHYVSIGNPDLIGKRDSHPVKCPPGGTLGDYVPFYFTPGSPMLLNVKTGYNDITKRANEDIVILTSSLHHLKTCGVPFLFTDRHASLAAARFHSDSELSKLDQIDWHHLSERDFKRDPDDPGKFERYQAEALVHQHLPINALLGLVCYNDSVEASLKAEVASRGLNLKTFAKPKWYF